MTTRWWTEVITTVSSTEGQAHLTLQGKTTDSGGGQESGTKLEEAAAE